MKKSAFFIDNADFTDSDQLSGSVYHFGITG